MLAHVLPENLGRERCNSTLAFLDSSVFLLRQLALWQHSHIEANCFKRDPRFEHNLSSLRIRVNVELGHGSLVSNAIFCNAVGSAHYHKLSHLFRHIWKPG